MGLVKQGQLGVEVAATERWSIRADALALQIPTMGTNLLDASLSAPVSLGSESVRFRVTPGVSLPSGALGADGIATMRSSGSIDPTFSADLTTGGSLVGIGMLSARTPLFDGRDGVRDGVFVRTDLLGGYRVGSLVPLTGLSWLHQAPDALGARDYSELAVVAGSVAHLSERWGLDARLRIPVMGETPLVGVLRVTTVVGGMGAGGQ